MAAGEQSGRHALSAVCAAGCFRTGLALDVDSKFSPGRRCHPLIRGAQCLVVVRATAQFRELSTGRAVDVLPTVLAPFGAKCPPRGRGGGCPAGRRMPFEEPELYAEELRAFFRPYRAATG